MDIRLLFPNDYIKAADLRGNDVTLTIKDVRVEELRTTGGNEEKAVVTFEELERRKKKGPHKLVLNKTNAQTIAKALGSNETEDWKGQKITLYPTTCQAFGETVDCVRIREKAPSPKKKVDEDPLGSDEEEVA